jgi:mRNA interferase MazF
LVVSVDAFNHGPAQLVVVLPITTTARGVPFHVPLGPSEAGIRRRSFNKCEDIRSISRERLMERWGLVSPGIMDAVEERIRILLSL